MNGAGFEPTHFNVLVKPEVVEKETAGGLLLPEEALEKKGFARQKGKLVAASPLAFGYSEWPEGAKKPQVGQTVMFAKYNATEFEGDDGETYWLMKDESVMGICDE